MSDNKPDISAEAVREWVLCAREHYHPALAALLEAQQAEIERLREMAGPLATMPVYDPDFGDEQICECGHPYYRHFDSYEKMAPVGCKYCPCPEFKMVGKDASE